LIPQKGKNEKKEKKARTLASHPFVSTIAHPEEGRKRKESGESRALFKKKKKKGETRKGKRREKKKNHEEPW